ncbi:hypothetical protein Efla_003993 [Eimeria flavescens]
MCATQAGLRWMELLRDIIIGIATPTRSSSGLWGSPLLSFLQVSSKVLVKEAVRRGDTRSSWRLGPHADVWDRGCHRQSRLHLGAAYGTAKSGVGVSSVGVMRPDLIMRSILPVIMAGILGIYGLIISIVISSVMGAPDVYSAYAGFGHLAGGLAVGLSSLAAGLAIGIVGDAGVRANAQQPKLFFGVTLILIFAEAIGLYGEFRELCFVHYQTANTPAHPGDPASNADASCKLQSQPWEMNPQVARIRAKQEEDAVNLIEAHLSEPYTITVYRYFLRNWPHLSILAYKASQLVGVVISKLECKDEICMLHGAYSHLNGGRAGLASPHEAHEAQEVHEEGLKRLDFNEDSAPDGENSYYLLSKQQKQTRQLPATGHQSRREASSFPALLCNCHGQSCGSIGMLAVRPEMRGRGIGKQLVRLVLQQQQKFVRVTQAAAVAAAPECREEQRDICEAILSGRTSNPALSSSAQSKLREVEAAVKQAMAGTSSENSVPVQHTGVSNLAASIAFSEEQLLCRLQHCSLDMEAGNTAALRLYTSVGFVISGYRRRYYCSGKDAYKMLYIF